MSDCIGISESRPRAMLDPVAGDFTAMVCGCAHCLHRHDEQPNFQIEMSGFGVRSLSYFVSTMCWRLLRETCCGKHSEQALSQQCCFQPPCRPALLHALQMLQCIRAQGTVHTYGALKATNVTFGVRLPVSEPCCLLHALNQPVLEDAQHSAQLQHAAARQLDPAGDGCTGVHGAARSCFLQLLPGAVSQQMVLPFFDFGNRANDCVWQVTDALTGRRRCAASSWRCVTSVLHFFFCRLPTDCVRQVTDALMGMKAVRGFFLALWLYGEGADKAQERLQRTMQLLADGVMTPIKGEGGNLTPTSRSDVPSCHHVGRLQLAVMLFCRAATDWCLLSDVYKAAGANDCL